MNPVHESPNIRPNHYRDLRRGGRAVECTGLENRHRLIAYPGFESLSLRQLTISIKASRPTFAHVQQHVHQNASDPLQYSLQSPSIALRISTTGFGAKTCAVQAYTSKDQKSGRPTIIEVRATRVSPPPFMPAAFASNNLGELQVGTFQDRRSWIT